MLDTFRVAARRAAYVIVLAVAFAGGSATIAIAAQAQPSPSPVPSPSAAPLLNGTAVGPAPKTISAPKTVGHYPIIDIIPIFSQPDAYANSSQLKGYDPMDVAGTIRIPITRTVSVSVDRLVDALFNVPTEPYITAAGKTAYPATTRDEKLLYHADAVFGRFTVTGGFSFRQRDDAGGGNGVSDAPFPYTVSSTEHHYGYLGVTYLTSPIRWLANSSFALNVNGYAQPVDHHVGTLCSASLVDTGVCTTAGSVYYVNEDPHQNMYYESSQSVALMIPLHPNLTITVSETIGALNFYENADGPYRWDDYDVEAITKKFSPTFSLTMRHQALHQALQGYPFPYPQAINTGVYDIYADFHFDLNQLVHR